MSFALEYWTLHDFVDERAEAVIPVTNSVDDTFNLGLFRGLAGVGYTLLRQIDGSLPNILIWE